MTMEREKEREWELEGAMYTNCLLLGLDLSSLTAGNGGAAPRLGLFRHSNPKLGEQLLYFLLSSVRGPAQSAKDFDKLWPIFDSAQSRDFRKVVQSIISELESQGALPRSNSRVSSLATCCGPRFVELLWQLSVHALREVHRRTFADDVAANPLPASLTDASYSHASALLPVTKARIALERRKFLGTANTAVQRQAMWASLAQDITAEFRGLCVEEAYLQQELEKIQDLRNKSKLDGELWDDRGSSSLSQNSHMVSKATRLWESLLARKSQHEVLASGPIEDLIAHREHRYRISGSALLAAMDQSSQVKPDLFSDQASDVSVNPNNHDISLNKEGGHEIINVTQVQAKDEGLAKMDERSGRVHPTVDIAEILRRWTHALQRIHKQAIHLAKANDGEGPDLLRSASDVSSNGHAESLSAALSEHSQHLASIEAFVNQLKEVIPTMEESVAELTEEVNSILNVPSNEYDGRSVTPNQAQSSGRFLGSGSDEVQDIASKLSSVQLDMIPPTTALKLPQLFSVSPNLSTKSSNLQNRQAVASLVNKAEFLPDSKLGDQPSLNGFVDNSIQGGENSYAQSIRRSVREAALSTQVANSDAPQNSRSDGSLEHYFVPFQMTNDSTTAANRSVTNRRKQRLFAYPADAYEPKNNKTASSPLKTSKLDELGVPAPTNGFLSVDLDSAVSNPERRVFDGDETQEQIFSPPLLMDVSGFGDAYEDLLAPLSEVDAALMEK